jgi:hypothetical protein
VKIYLHDPVYTLGDTTFSVEESVSASRTLSSADILCEAGFQAHHICSPDTGVQELAARTASHDLSSHRLQPVGRRPVGIVDGERLGICLGGAAWPAGPAVEISQESPSVDTSGIIFEQCEESPNRGILASGPRLQLSQTKSFVIS